MKCQSVWSRNNGTVRVEWLCLARFVCVHVYVGEGRKKRSDDSYHLLQRPLSPRRLLEFKRLPHFISLVEEFRLMTQFILGLGRCLKETLNISLKALSPGTYVFQCKRPKCKERLAEGIYKKEYYFCQGTEDEKQEEPWTYNSWTAVTHKQITLTRIRMISSGLLSSTGIPLTSFSSSPTWMRPTTNTSLHILKYSRNVWF